MAFAPPQDGVIDAVSASRFLAQASFGPTVASMAAVRSIGPARWLEEQFAAPASEPLLPRVMAQYHALGGWAYDSPTFGMRNSELSMNECWRAFMLGEDELRQRVVAALLEIFVITTRVGVIGFGQNQAAAASYVDMLNAHAFGNFRDLLEAVTLSPAMGVFLSHRNNQKAEYDGQGAEVRVPDENFAREIMQLFSIGLVKLNADGSPKLRRGLPIDTYGASDVFNLARVFTGWRLTPRQADDDDFEEWTRPMQPKAEWHSPEEKVFLGKRIAPGTSAQSSLKQALNTLFRHANVGPFIGKQLIQRLVTSNPSPGYVARVSAAFDDNGRGVRGDLKAVVRAILLDAEARISPVPDSPAAARHGKPREPMMRLLAVARAMGASMPASLVFPIGNLSPASTGIGQSPLRAGSVFNFFRPGYIAPQSALAAEGLVAPEFQLLNGPVIAASINKINEFIRTAQEYFPVDLSPLEAVAHTPETLVDRVDLLLCGSTMLASDKAQFAALINTLPVQQTRWRAQVALQLCAASAAFLIQTV